MSLWLQTENSKLGGGALWLSAGLFSSISWYSTLKKSAGRVLICFLVLWKFRREANSPLVWTNWQTAVESKRTLAPWNQSLPQIFPLPTLIPLQPTELVPRDLFPFHKPLSVMVQQHLISCLKFHILCHEQMPVFRFH